MKRKLLQYFLILFTVFSCKSVYYVNNSIYELKNKENNYEFVWKETLKKTADASVYYPLWFRINLPSKIKNFELDDDSFVFEYSNGQVIIIYESYYSKLNNNESTFTFDFIDDEDDLKEIVNNTYKHKILKNIKLKTSRESFIYTDGVSKILLLNLKEESVDHFKDIVSSLKYINNTEE